MNRKIIILVAATAVMSAAHMAAAEPAGKVYRIGWLTVSRINPAFRQGMRELGYIEGKNLTYEFRKRIRPATYLNLAKELVALKVDIILAVGVGAKVHARRSVVSIWPFSMKRIRPLAWRQSRLRRCCLKRMFVSSVVC